MFGGGRKSARAGLPKLSSTEKSQVSKLEKLIESCTSSPKGMESFGEISSKLAGASEGVNRGAVRLVRKRLQAKDERHAFLALKLAEKLVSEVESARTECACGPGGKKFCDAVLKLALESRDARLMNQARSSISLWAEKYGRQSRQLPYFATTKVELDSQVDPASESEDQRGRRRQSSTSATSSNQETVSATREEGSSGVELAIDDQDLGLARQAQSMSETLESVADAADLETMSDVKMQCVQTLENVRSRVADLASSENSPNEATLQALIAAQDTLSAKLESFERTTDTNAGQQSDQLLPASTAPDDATQMFDALFGSVPVPQPSSAHSAEPSDDRSQQAPVTPPQKTSEDPNAAILSMFATAPSSEAPPSVVDDAANNPSSPYDSVLMRRKQEQRPQGQDDAAFFASPVPVVASASPTELPQTASTLPGSAQAEMDDSAQFSAAALQGVFGDVVDPSAANAQASSAVEVAGDNPPGSNVDAAAAFGDVQNPSATLSEAPPGGGGEVSPRDQSFAAQVPAESEKSPVSDDDPFSGLTSSEPASSFSLPPQQPQQQPFQVQPAFPPPPGNTLPATEFAESPVPPQIAPQIAPQANSATIVVPPLVTPIAPSPPEASDVASSQPVAVAEEAPAATTTGVSPHPQPLPTTVAADVPPVQRSDSSMTSAPPPPEPSILFAQLSTPAGTERVPPLPAASTLDSAIEERPSAFSAAPLEQQASPATFSESPSQQFVRPAPPPPPQTTSSPQQQSIPFSGQQPPVDASASLPTASQSVAATPAPPLSREPSVEASLSAPAATTTTEKGRPLSNSLPLPSSSSSTASAAVPEEPRAVVETEAKPSAPSPAVEAPKPPKPAFSSSFQGFSEFDSAFSGPPVPPKVVSDSAFAPLDAFGAATTPFAVAPAQATTVAASPPPPVAATPQPQPTPVTVTPQVPVAFSQNLVAPQEVDDDPFAGIVDETPPPPPPQIPASPIPQVELSIHTSPRPSSVGSSNPPEEMAPAPSAAAPTPSAPAPAAAPQPQDPFSGLFSW